MKRAMVGVLAGGMLACASGCAFYINSPGAQLTAAMSVTGVNNHGTAMQPIMPGASSNAVSAGSESTGGLGGGGSGGGGGGSATLPDPAGLPVGVPDEIGKK